MSRWARPYLLVLWALAVVVLVLGIIFLLLRISGEDIEAQSQSDEVQVAPEVTVDPGGGDAAKYGYAAPWVQIGEGGDLGGMRNLNGGWWDPARPSMLNLDIGAGCTKCPDGLTHRGDVLLGADVSDDVFVHSGGKLVARFDEKGLTVYGRIRVRGAP